MSYARMMQEAESNWPEDEARLTFSWIVECRNEGYPASDSEINNQITHMTNQFMREGDGAALVSRYRAELYRLLNAEE